MDSDFEKDEDLNRANDELPSEEEIEEYELQGGFVAPLSLAENYLSCIDPYREIVAGFAKTAQSFLSGVSPVFRESASLAASFVSSDWYEKVKETFLGFQSILADIRWEKHASAARVWGSYGWGTVDALSLGDFLNPPSSKGEADRLMLNAVTALGIDCIITEVQEGCSNRRQLNNAVECFNRGDYSSCAMALFSLVDRCVILNQKRMNPGKGYYRPCDKALFDRVRADAETDSEAKDVLDATSALLLCEAYACFYKPMEGFSHANEGELNRHMLMHGMMTKCVTKKSCVKLFCLLLGTQRVLL